MGSTAIKSNQNKQIESNRTLDIQYINSWLNYLDKNPPNRIPLNWPKDIRYVNSCLNYLDENPPYAAIAIKYKKIEIQKLPNNHPAYCVEKQTWGLFCRKTIEANMILGEYAGICKTKKEYQHDNSSAYILYHGGGLYIDAKKAGNELRFINDYRGVSPEPNVKFCREDPQITRNFRNISMVGYSVVKACKLINPGEEILVDYGEKYCLDWGISAKINQ